MKRIARRAKIQLDTYLLSSFEERRYEVRSSPVGRVIAYLSLRSSYYVPLLSFLLEKVISVTEVVEVLSSKIFSSKGILRVGREFFVPKIHSFLLL